MKKIKVTPKRKGIRNPYGSMKTMKEIAEAMNKEDLAILKKDDNKKHPPYTDKVTGGHTITFGSKGQGKSVVASDVMVSWSSNNQDSFEHGAVYIPVHTPYSDEYLYGSPKWESGWYKPESLVEETKTPPKNVKYNPEELKGRFIAYATIKRGIVEHKGILYVRKCGAWKLVDCVTLVTVASASAGATLPDHTIHYYIYQDKSEGTVRKPAESGVPTLPETKPKRKPNRFDDLEVVD